MSVDRSVGEDFDKAREGERERERERVSPLIEISGILPPKHFSYTEH